MCGVRTPAENVAGNEEAMRRRECLDDESSQVETLAEHPEEIARDEVLSDDM